MTIHQTGPGKYAIYPSSNAKRLSLLYNFDIGGHELKREHRSFLDNYIIRSLGPDGSTTLRGLTSRSGAASFNQGLSELRLKSVMDYLRTKAPNSHIFTQKALGETAAQDAGQKDGIEDETYRGVTIAISDKPLPHMVPLLNVKPVEVTAKAKIWRKVEMSMRAESAGFWPVQKMYANLYMQMPECWFVYWPVSQTSVNLSVQSLHGPPVFTSDFGAMGASFYIDPYQFEPMTEWNDKTLFMRRSLSTITLTIKNGLPKMPAADYQPIKGPGITISGRDLTFSLRSNTPVTGVDKGVTGYLEKAASKIGNCYDGMA